MRYAGQKRRATTSKTYSIKANKNECITEAKRLHRLEKCFYIVNVNGYYSSVGIIDYSLYYTKENNIEKWTFSEENRRWKVEGLCE